MEFEEYAAARWPVLYRTALLLTGARAEAEDLAQGTLIRAYAAWPRVARADSPDAYVRRMLVNEFLTERRRTARRTRLEPPVKPRSVIARRAPIQPACPQVQPEPFRIWHPLSARH